MSWDSQISELAKKDHTVNCFTSTKKGSHVSSFLRSVTFRRFRQRHLAPRNRLPLDLLGCRCSKLCAWSCWPWYCQQAPKQGVAALCKRRLRQRKGLLRKALKTRQKVGAHVAMDIVWCLCIFSVWTFECNMVLARSNTLSFRMNTSHVRHLAFFSVYVFEEQDIQSW